MTAADESPGVAAWLQDIREEDGSAIRNPREVRQQVSRVTVRWADGGG